MCANKFKVGDRVRVLHTDYPEEIPVGTITTVARIDGDGDVHLDGKTVRELFFYDHEIEPAPQQLTITAGRYYRTRDGRKVGPMEETRYSNGSGNPAWPYTVGLLEFWTKAGKGYWGNEGGEILSEIIAEWADEPVVATTCVPKFKVGDRVENAFPGNDYDMLGTVTDVTTKHLRVRRDGTCGDLPDDGLNWRESELRLITPATTAQCIVALIKNGQPKPASRPFVHPDREAATKEACRLAGKHKGQEFGVYELVSSEKQAKVYEHEWQRLAAGGDTYHARRELQRTGITGIQASSIVQEFVAAA